MQRTKYKMSGRTPHDPPPQWVEKYRTIPDTEAAVLLGQSLRKIRRLIEENGLCLRLGKSSRRLTATHMQKLERLLTTEPLPKIGFNHLRTRSGASTPNPSVTRAQELVAKQRAQEQEKRLQAKGKRTKK